MSEGRDIGAIKMGSAERALEFRTWGGRRRGAGRKPSKPGIHHRRVRRRPALSGREPVHVVVRVVPAVGRLRRPKAYQAIRRALITVLLRGRMRVVHLSIQRNHVHPIVEAGDERALARGMQGFQISAARHLNAAVSVEVRRAVGGRAGRSLLREPRRGQVFTDRYHAEIIDTPRRARHCLAYVLNNWRRHREDQAGPRQRSAPVDPYSSGICFDGWADHSTPFAFPRGYQPLVVSPASSWLLTTGWRRWGPIDLAEVPGPTPHRPREQRDIRPAT
jgi:REP element-mobilizing transposase RayT